MGAEAAEPGALPPGRGDDSWEYGYRKNGGEMVHFNEEPWRTRGQAESWMLTNDTLVRRWNPEPSPGPWLEVRE